MIDWSKERATENYCGYCHTPHICSCDGSCFTRSDWETCVINKFRLMHVKKELSKIPELKKTLKQREKDLKDELRRLEESS